MSTVDPSKLEVLRSLATERDHEYLDALEKTDWNTEAAARLMDVAGGTIRGALRNMKRRLVDIQKNVADGQTVKGISTLRNGDGIALQEWVKTSREGIDEEDASQLPDPKTIVKESMLFDASGKVIQRWVGTKPELVKQVHAWEAYAEQLAERVEVRRPIPAPGVSTNSELLNLYTMTDSHIGMLAWGRETQGRDWDLAIARETLTACFSDMVARSPDAETCVVAQLGDWMHYDSLEAVTPTSGHIVDADSRAGKMVPTACDTLEDLVDMALQKHNTVHLLVAEGNHDMYGSLFLRTMFRRIYRDNPRVKIIESENPYYAMRFGVTMLGWHHGHKKGPSPNLVEVFSSMYRPMWGEAEHCVIHTGDKHHKMTKEYAGATIEQHGTLAANDAYAIRGGWRSHQYAEAITYHRTMGEAGRVRTNPSMVGL